MQHSEHSDKIDTALRDLIAERGWSAVTMAELADRAGIDLGALYEASGSRTRALIAAFDRVDRQVLEAGAADAGDTPRDRLFEIMMRRYDALVPWRAALKRLARELPFDPPSLLAVDVAAERSMARMLEAARLAGDGLAGQIRRRGLFAIHLAVLRAFVDDDSADLSATMKALDGRLKSIERWAEMLERFTPKRPGRAVQQDVSTGNPVVDDPENVNSQPVL